jgi:hypothetical protein
MFGAAMGMQSAVRTIQSLDSFIRIISYDHIGHPEQILARSLNHKH